MQANEKQSTKDDKHYYQNLDNSVLIDHSLARNEGVLSEDGALMVTTGDHTGRSPKDKFFVRSASTDHKIWWAQNAAMTPQAFETLKNDMMAHIDHKDMYTQDLYACADPRYRLNVRIITELAWHALFIKHLLRVPDNLDNFNADYTIINAPSFKASPDRHGCRSETIIAINMDEKLVLIGGTEYAGEIKKAVFTILNYLLPDQNVMPMHCSANYKANDAHDTALFFGLSGTGKTTLSADSARCLIGDDEHGWSDNGIFNFEGGCYAKTINLSEEAEPEIYAATKMPGAVIENSIGKPNNPKQPDFENAELTANMRCAYPLDAIPNACKTSMAGHPRHVIMLTCDAFGVLPPLARLDQDQAIYYFLNGFTAKVTGTEQGITEPQPTFSTCFGAPFMPRHPMEYGDLFRDKIKTHNSQCWLLNTGWTGGPYGTGSRIPIAVTRTILNAILNNDLNTALFRTDDIFGFAVPEFINGLKDQSLLTPRETWNDKSAYDAQAKKLHEMFEENFRMFMV